MDPFLHAPAKYEKGMVGDCFFVKTQEKRLCHLGGEDSTEIPVKSSVMVQGRLSYFLRI